jgi:hypothetical protein
VFRTLCLKSIKKVNKETQTHISRFGFGFSLVVFKQPTSLFFFVYIIKLIKMNKQRRNREERKKRTQKIQQAIG